MPLPPAYWQAFRHTVGRAFRESGQALDQLALRMAATTNTPHDFYDDPILPEDHLSRHRTLTPTLYSGRPLLSNQMAYVAPCATLVGSVYCKADSSIWYGAILRADTCLNADQYDRLPVTVESHKLGFQLPPPPPQEQIEHEEQQKLQSSSESQQQTEEQISQHQLQEQQNNLQQVQQLQNQLQRQPLSIEPNYIDDDVLERFYLPWKIFDESKLSLRELEQYEKDQAEFQKKLSQSIPVRFDAPKGRSQTDEGIRSGGAIFIGRGTNVQDGAIITARKDHTLIGDGVTIGHLAQIHSATIGDYCLIGMGCYIGEGAIIESESLIGAGAVVSKGQVVPAGTVWVGNPARQVRELTVEQRSKLKAQAEAYVEVAHTHRPAMELGGNLSHSMIDQHNELLLELEAEVMMLHQQKLEAKAQQAAEVKESERGEWEDTPSLPSGNNNINTFTTQNQPKPKLA